jgi:hypothetical protein
VTTSFGNGQQVYLIKTNAAGDTMWTRVFGGTYMDAAYSVQQTNDGGYVLGGISSSFGSFDAYVVKTNASGDTIWTRTYGGSSTEFGQSIQQTQDSGYIVSGYSVSFGDSSQVYLVKTNVSGDTMWTRTYGGARNEDGYSVRQTQDGGYIVAGATNSFGAGLQDVYLLRLNASGDTLWTRTYGGSSTDVGKSVQQTSDMGYIVAGHSSSYGAMQVYLIKTDAEGNAWVEESHQPQTPDSRIRATLVLGMLCLPGGQSVGSSPSWLLDIDGRKVLDLAPGANDVSHLATGVYFVQFGRGEFSRVVVVR